MNEPQSKCRVVFGTDWSAYQQVMIERIRRISADLPLFLTGGCWSNIEGFADLDTDLLHDRRNFVSIHFYYPFLFTHQGATWSEALSRRHDRRALSGVGRQSRRHARLDAARASRRFRCRRRSIATPRRAKAEAQIERYFREAKARQQVEEWMSRVADWQHRQQRAVRSHRLHRIRRHEGDHRRRADSTAPRAPAGCMTLRPHRQPRLGLDRLCAARRSVRPLCA